VAGFRSNPAEIARLGKSKGAIVAFEVDGVLARFTKKGGQRARKDLDFDRSMRSVLSMVGIVATHIRRRVSQDGDLASSNKGWDRHPPGSHSRQGIRRPRDLRRRKYVVESAYADLVPGDASPANTSDAWHRQAGIGANTFKNTGGMWKGLQVRQRGTNGAQIDFRGSSVGGTGKAARGFKKVKDKDTGKTSFKEVKRTESTRLNVRNQEKAGRIMYRQGVNVVQPTPGENLAMSAAVAASAQISLLQLFTDQSKPHNSRLITATIEPGQTGDRRLFDLLMRRWVKR
jgi:hypothetical protein